MGRLVDRLQVHLDVRVSSRVLFGLEGLAGEHALICVQYLVSLLLGLQDLLTQILLELVVLLGLIWFQSFLPTDHLLLDAVEPVDLRQQRLVHLSIWVLPLE